MLLLTATLTYRQGWRREAGERQRLRGWIEALDTCSCRGRRTHASNGHGTWEESPRLELAQEAGEVGHQLQLRCAGVHRPRRWREVSWKRQRDSRSSHQKCVLILQNNRARLVLNTCSCAPHLFVLSLLFATKCHRTCLCHFFCTS
jgi:hypothetical protein